MFKALCSVTLSALLVFTAVAQTNPGTAAKTEAAAAPSTLVGCVQKAGGIYTLTDETSKVTAQLNGDGLKAGRHVQVTGTMATGANSATEILNVASVTGVAGSCQAPTHAAFAGSDSSKRAKVIGILVIGSVIAGGAIATVARQGSARGTTNNNAPVVQH